MTPQDAMKAIGNLAGTTNGWDDASTIAYADELANLSDPKALTRACRLISTTWKEYRRPPISVIIDQYHREVARVAAVHQPRALGQHYPTFEEGVEIAWKAYCQEVTRQGREPSRKVFEKWLPR